jgi:hypothetical protein
MPRYVCAANACINGTLHLALTQASAIDELSKNSDSDFGLRNQRLLVCPLRLGRGDGACAI